MKFVSIDLETTGLDPAIHEIIEFGAVSCDTKDSTKWDTFRAIVIHERLIVDPYCASLHQDLWPLLVEGNKLVGKNCDDPTSTHVLKDDIHYVVPCDLGRQVKKWLETLGYDDGAINVAGKNFGTFDLQFLKLLHGWNVRTRHRILDPCMLYWKHDEDVALPNMQKCCERADIALEGYHTAVGDAITVAQLIMKALP